jgi:hypothetical protein
MATNDFIVIEGLSAATATLNGLPKQIQRSAISAAARKASKPLIAESREKLKNIGTDAKNKGEDSSKSLLAARYLKAVNKRASGIPGVRVLFKGGSIPMSDSKSFGVDGYAKLMAYGSYKVGDRHHKSGKNTGQTFGDGNFVLDAFDKVGTQVDSIFSKNLLNEMDRALNRALKRVAKKLR